jgi:hypothetical protein
VSGYVNIAVANSRRNRARPAAPGKFMHFGLDVELLFRVLERAPTEHSFFFLNISLHAIHIPSPLVLESP